MGVPFFFIVFSAAESAYRYLKKPTSKELAFPFLPAATCPRLIIGHIRLVRQDFQKHPFIQYKKYSEPGSPHPGYWVLKIKKLTKIPIGKLVICCYGNIVSPVAVDLRGTLYAEQMHNFYVSANILRQIRLRKSYSLLERLCLRNLTNLWLTTEYKL